MQQGGRRRRGSEEKVLETVRVSEKKMRGVFV